MGVVMIADQEPRRKFFSRLPFFALSLLPFAFLLHASQNPEPRPRLDPKNPSDDETPMNPASRDAVLKENEKDIKKKVERLLQLATELKEEVDKTNSTRVLSVAMLKKADEIERLAKDIKTRAKG
jgi:hypothetical protein